MDMRISLLVITLGFLAAATFADDKPTSLGDARAAVEANLKTPEGKTYDEKLEKEFVDKHLGAMKQCKQGAGSDLENLDTDETRQRRRRQGSPLLHPATKMGTCAREALLKSTFSPPPRAAYWVSVYMKLTH